MSSTTIYCTRDTYVSSSGKNTNYAGASRLLTGRTGKTAIIGKDTKQTALLQFSIPKNIQYKHITKVALHFYFGSDLPETMKWSGLYYTPYLIDNTTAAITYNTVGTLGVLGETKYVDRDYNGGDWISEDVTDIFINNMTNGIFSVFVGAGPTATSTEMDYSYIGGISGSKDSYLVITYEDVEQLPPTITYPSDVYVRQGEPVLFSWVYNSLTAATQASVTLEWKAESASEYNVINLTQTAQSYMADIEFPAGTIDWRIRVTNDVGETSAYSEAKFVVIGKPSVPIITDVKNRTLTEITWNASDQCVYDIAITDAVGNILLSETVHSGEMSYKPQMFLANGTYNIRLRTKNSIELWSDYVSKTITINAVAPVQPTLVLLPETAKVTISVGHAEGTKAAILRSENGGEFEVISVLEDGVTDFVDDTVKSRATYTYKVRAYLEGYADSATRSASFSFEGIYLQGNGRFIHMTKAEDTFFTHSEALGREVVLKYYSGRELPVAERGEHKTRNIQKKAYIEFEEKALFETIAESEKAFYRDSDGNALACVVSSTQYNRYKNAGCHVSFEITEVEQEGVVINV